jgi:predicted permease
MVDILNLALPNFGLIFIGFACAKAKGMPEQGLAWMNFFLLYVPVSLPALLFGIMSKTPFEELNNPPFLIATILGTATAFVLALSAGRLIGRLTLREATLAGLSGSYGNIGYMGPGLRDVPISDIATPYSISSSARPSNDWGTVRPNVFAVLRLMIISTFVARWTGRSAGFSPLRI